MVSLIFTFIVTTIGPFRLGVGLFETYCVIRRYYKSFRVKFMGVSAYSVAVESIPQIGALLLVPF